MALDEVIVNKQERSQVITVGTAHAQRPKNRRKVHTEYPQSRRKTDAKASPLQSDVTDVDSL